MTPESSSAIGSYWAASAIAPPALPALDRDFETDVAIVGGGFTGLTTAHYLQRSGIGCAVFEANNAGWGASGRNGGMAVLRYKSGWAALAREFGDERARRMHGVLHDAIDSLEATAAEYGIAQAFSRCGHITAAHGAKPLANLESDVRWLERELGYEGASILSRTETERTLGTRAYVGAFLDRRSGEVHPLSYVRGLAAGVARKLPVFVSSPVSGYRRDAAGFVLDTPRGRVRAKRIVFGMNGYAGLCRLPNDLARRVVPVRSSIVATAPLSTNLARRLLPDRHVVTDSKRVNAYFRLTPDNRLLFGNRGHLANREEPSAYAHVEALMARTFPDLAGQPIDFRWSGNVAMTLDFFPHVGEAEPGVFFAMGYSGRGVVLSHLLGKALAGILRGDALDVGPLSNSPFPAIPLHRFHPLGTRVVTAWYRLRDRLDASA